MFTNEFKKTLFKRRTILVVLTFFLIQFSMILINSSNSKIYTEKFNTVSNYYGSDSITFHDYVNFIEVNKLELYSNHEYSIVGERLNIYENTKENLKTEGINLVDKKSLDMYKSQTEQKRLDFEIEQNMVKQKLDYSISNDYLINKLELINIIQITSILLAFYLVYDIFFDAIKNDLIDMNQTLVFGKKKNFIVKLLVLMLILFIYIAVSTLLRVIILLYYENNLFTTIAYIRPLSNLQLITSYFNYLIINVFISLITSMSLSLIFLFILSISKNIMVSTIVLIFSISISFWLSNYINPNSSYNIFIYFNLYYPFFTNILTYNNFSLGNNVFNVAKTTLAILIIILPILSYGSFICKYNQISSKNQIKITSPKRISSISGHNLFNLLFSQKLIIPILLVIIYTVFQYKDFSVVKNPSEQYFEIYQIQFLGHLDESTYELIKVEQNKIKSAEDNLKLIQENKIEDITMSEEDISEILSNKSNLDRVIDEITEIEFMGGSYYLNDEGTRLLFSTDSKFYNATFISINMILIGIVATVSGGFEKSIGITDLIETTREGHLKHDRNKYFLMATLISILIIFVYIMQFIKINNNFSINLNASLTDSINVLSSMSIFYGYILLVVQVLIFSNILFYTCFYLSKHNDFILVMIGYIIIMLVTIWAGVFTDWPSLLNIMSYKMFNYIPLVIFIDLVFLFTVYKVSSNTNL